MKVNTTKKKIEDQTKVEVQTKVDAQAKEIDKDLLGCIMDPGDLIESVIRSENIVTMVAPINKTYVTKKLHGSVKGALDLGIDIITDAVVLLKAAKKLGIKCKDYGSIAKMYVVGSKVYYVTLDNMINFFATGSKYVTYQTKAIANHVGLSILNNNKFKQSHSKDAPSINKALTRAYSVQTIGDEVYIKYNNADAAGRMAHVILDYNGSSKAGRVKPKADQKKLWGALKNKLHNIWHGRVRARTNTLGLSGIYPQTISMERYMRTLLDVEANTLLGDYTPVVVVNMLDASADTKTAEKYNIAAHNFTPDNMEYTTDARNNCHREVMKKMWKQYGAIWRFSANDPHLAFGAELPSKEYLDMYYDRV